MQIILIREINHYFFFSSFNDYMKIWSLRPIKVRILICSHVSTIVWLHNLEFNEMSGEKATWKLYIDTACYLEQIQQAAPDKISPVWPLTFDLTKVRQTRHAGLFWRSKAESISNVLLWTSTCGLHLWRHWMHSRGLSKNDSQSGQMVRESRNTCLHDD